MKKSIPFYFILLVLNVSSFGKIILKIDFQDTQPKYIKNSNGAFSGLCVELLSLIEAHSNYKFKNSNFFVPAKRIYHNMENGKSDVHMGWCRNSKREKFFIFGEPLYEVSTMLISNKDYPKDLKDLEFIENSSILAISGIGSNEYLRNYLGLNLDDSGKDINANLRKLQSKRGDLFTYHNLGLLYKIQNSKYKEKFKIHDIKLRTYNHWMVFSKSIPQSVIDEIGITIKKLKKSGEWGYILDKYRIRI